MKRLSLEHRLKTLRDLGVADVLEALCKSHHASLRLTLGRDRTARVANARNACWSFMHRVRDPATNRRVYSLSELGRLWGRDHTTVRSGLHAFEALAGLAPVEQGVGDPGARRVHRWVINGDVVDEPLDPERPHVEVGGRPIRVGERVEGRCYIGFFEIITPRAA